MERKIFKTGHSLALTIPKKILEKLGFKIGDKLELDFEEKSGELVIKKSKNKSQLDLGLKFRHRLGEAPKERKNE